MMTLLEYKQKHKLRLDALAEMLGLSPAHTSELVNGKTRCSLEVAVRIEDLTKGKVRCRDLLEASQGA